MRLIFFTPTNEASAIGGISCLLANTLLSQGHIISIVCTEIKEILGKKSHPFNTSIIPWTNTAQIVKLAIEADAIFYQIGNSFLFHQGCLEWLPRLPGIILLHDFFLGHLFLEWGAIQQPQAKKILCAWYGSTVADHYFLNAGSKSFINDTRDSAPMTEWICSMGTGVITHSAWGTNRVLSSCPGPVRIISLCPNKAINLSLLNNKLNSKNNDFNLLTIGHMNLNKRINSVIQAIGQSSILSQHTQYHLAGKIEPDIKKEIIELAKKLSVKVHIYDEVDDEKLNTLIHKADVVSCLRLPALEAASASLVEALLNGKATVVTNVGFYTEIPDNCVIKINLDNELLELQSALETLFFNPEKRQALALRGQQWATETFTVENYVTQLLETVKDTLQGKPILDAARYFVKLMQNWGATESLINDEKIIKPLSVFEIS